MIDRRNLLRGVFAMPAVVLTSKSLMPIKAFALTEPAPSKNEIIKEALDKLSRPPTEGSGLFFRHWFLLRPDRIKEITAEGYRAIRDSSGKAKTRIVYGCRVGLYEIPARMAADGRLEIVRLVKVREAFIGAFLR